MKVCKQRVYLNAEGTKLVPHESDERNSLFCSEGRQMPENRLENLENADEFFRDATDDDVKKRSVIVIPASQPQSSQNTLSTGETRSDDDLVRVHKSEGEEKPVPAKKAAKKTTRKRG